MTLNGTIGVIMYTDIIDLRGNLSCFEMIFSCKSKYSKKYSALE